MIYDIYCCEESYRLTYISKDRQQASGEYLNKWVSSGKKTESNGKKIIEESQTRFQRIKNLEKIRKYRNEGRSPIIYTDESLVASSHTSHHSRTDGPTKAIKKPLSKGNRLVTWCARVVK